MDMDIYAITFYCLRTKSCLFPAVSRFAKNKGNTLGGYDNNKRDM